MSGAAPARPALIRRDQQRALDAYKCAEKAKKCGYLGEYETAVQTFAASLLRGGLAVAVSVLERGKARAAIKQLLTDLAHYRQRNPPAERAEKWPGIIRALPDTSQYMRTTREFIALTAWLQRACRASGEPQPPSGGEPQP